VIENGLTLLLLLNIGVSEAKFKDENWVFYDWMDCERIDLVSIVKISMVLYESVRKEKGCDYSYSGHRRLLRFRLVRRRQW
jgi:hypothetical protein